MYDIAEHLTPNFYQNYLYATSGFSQHVIETVKEYGIALGTDIPDTTIIYGSNNNRQKLKEIFLTKLNKDMGKYFSGYELVEKSQRNKVKEHILKYGAVGYSLDRWATRPSSDGKTCYVVSGKDTGHAITIIGWDDEYTNGVYTGAWIIQDSRGNDRYHGEKYVFYDDSAPVMSSKYVIPIISEENVPYKLKTTSTGNYIPHIEERSADKIITKNIFKWKQPIDIKYTCDEEVKFVVKGALAKVATPS